MAKSKGPEKLIDPKASEPWEVLLWQQHLLLVVGSHFWTDAPEDQILRRHVRLEALTHRSFSIHAHLADPQIGVPGMPVMLHKITRTA
jgi:hypothetical protein